MLFIQFSHFLSDPDSNYPGSDSPYTCWVTNANVDTQQNCWTFWCASEGDYWQEAQSVSAGNYGTHCVVFLGSDVGINQACNIEYNSNNNITQKSHYCFQTTRTNRLKIVGIIRIPPRWKLEYCKTFFLLEIAAHCVITMNA